MKPVVDTKRCFASKSVCKAIKVCPVEAISYIEVDEPILDKILNCICSPPNPTEGNLSSCKCDCESGCNSDDPLYRCGGTPYGRIIIDYEKCTECGICAEECCGTAIDMV